MFAGKEQFLAKLKAYSWEFKRQHLNCRTCEIDRGLGSKVQQDFCQPASCIGWAAVKELKLSYYIGESLLFTIYTHYGNLI